MHLNEGIILDQLTEPYYEKGIYHSCLCVLVLLKVWIYNEACLPRLSGIYLFFAGVV